MTDYFESELCGGDVCVRARHRVKKKKFVFAIPPGGQVCVECIDYGCTHFWDGRRLRGQIFYLFFYFFITDLPPLFPFLFIFLGKQGGRGIGFYLLFCFYCSLK